MRNFRKKFVFDEKFIKSFVRNYKTVDEAIKISIKNEKKTLHFHWYTSTTRLVLITSFPLWLLTTMVVRLWKRYSYRSSQIVEGDFRPDHAPDQADRPCMATGVRMCRYCRRRGRINTWYRNDIYLPLHIAIRAVSIAWNVFRYECMLCSLWSPSERAESLWYRSQGDCEESPYKYYTI